MPSIVRVFPKNSQLTFLIANTKFSDKTIFDKAHKQTKKKQLFIILNNS